MGQMKWIGQGNLPKILHVRESSTDPWLPYNRSPLAVPDYLIPGGSKGYATMQALLLKGFEMVPSDRP